MNQDYFHHYNADGTEYDPNNYEYYNHCSKVLNNMSYLLKEFIIKIPKDMYGFGSSGTEYAIQLAREEATNWHSHCQWDVWPMEDTDANDYLYCVTCLNLVRG